MTFIAESHIQMRQVWQFHFGVKTLLKLAPGDCDTICYRPYAGSIFIKDYTADSPTKGTKLSSPTLQKNIGNLGLCKGFCESVLSNLIL